jgi:Icc-related predicted phosphoesterase
MSKKTRLAKSLASAALAFAIVAACLAGASFAAQGFGARGGQYPEQGYVREYTENAVISANAANAANPANAGGKSDAGGETSAADEAKAAGEASAADEAKPAGEPAATNPANSADAANAAGAAGEASAPYAALQDGAGALSGPESGIRFGVISDTHVTATKATEQYRLKKAFEFFSERTDLVLVAGDLTDNGTEPEMETWKNIRDESLAVPLIASMGNHEFNRWENFENATGCKANEARIINGYYFIWMSPGSGSFDAQTGRATGNGTQTYAYAVDWLLEKLAEAEAADPDKPIFVFYHHPTLNTYYRTTASYDEAIGLKGILDGHSRVVAFSGHMHTPNNLATSLWQGSYTAVNTCTLSYVALEGGTLWGSSPPNRANFAQGMVVDVQDSKVEIKNYDFFADTWVNQTWTFDTAEPFPYTAEKRLAAAKKPQFAADAEIRVQNIADTQVTVNFDQAYIPEGDPTGNIVRLYSYNFINRATGNTDVSFTNPSEFHNLPTPGDITITNTGAARALAKGEAYDLRIYAIDTFDQVSDGYLEVAFQAGGSVLEPDAKLVIAADGKAVRKGDYFNVDVALDRVARSNAATLRFEFDADKFEYAGFTAAKGVTLLDAGSGAGSAALVLMTQDYAALHFGTAMFRAKEDADLNNGLNPINLFAQYAVKDEGGGKSLKSAAGSTSVYTSGGSLGTGEGGAVTLIDLSNVIDLFGADSSMPGWNEKYRQYDLDCNGRIEIKDIAMVAALIGA